MNVLTIGGYIFISMIYRIIRIFIFGLLMKDFGLSYGIASIVAFALAGVIGCWIGHIIFGSHRKYRF